MVVVVLFARIPQTAVMTRSIFMPFIFYHLLKKKLQPNEKETAILRDLKVLFFLVIGESYYQGLK